MFISLRLPERGERLPLVKGPPMDLSTCQADSRLPHAHIKKPSSKQTRSPDHSGRDRLTETRYGESKVFVIFNKGKLDIIYLLHEIKPGLSRVLMV